jgi:hypothetical protein
MLSRCWSSPLPWTPERLARLCPLVGYSESTVGFHAWASRPSSLRAQRPALFERVRQHHAATRRTYGSPRIYRDLRADDVAVGRKRGERPVRQDGLSGTLKPRRGQTTIRLPGVRVTDDLVKRNFLPPAPDQLWVADITYLYLARMAPSRRRRRLLQPPVHRRLGARGQHARRTRDHRARASTPTPTAGPPTRGWY